MEKKEFKKLVDLVGKNFTFIKNWGYKWERWNESLNDGKGGFEKSDTYQKYEDGWQKKYTIETDLGVTKLSNAQMSQLLTMSLKENVADLSNKVFEVNSNGKTGKDIRYWFRLKGDDVKKSEPQKSDPEEKEISIEDIPF